MNNLISTLVVEALDGSLGQGQIHATSVANSASTGKLAIQVDGAFQAGGASAAGANALIKMSAATTMADGTTSVMSTSEFKKGDIISSNYTAASSPADATSTVDYSAATVVKLGGQFFVRLERKDGQGINDTETYSGETVAQIVTAFAARKSAGTTEFSNLTLSDAGSSVLNIVIDARDENSGLIISANDNATITNNAPANDVGSLTAARKLEKLGFITQGAYNQYGFPIVNPETSTAAGQDYGIYTIELRKKVGGRFVFETIKVLIQDDEASVQKTVKFIENVLGLSSADLAVPVVTSTVVSMVTDTTGGTGAGDTYSTGSTTAIFVKATNLEVGTTAILTINSDATSDTGHGRSQEFAVATAEEVFAVTVADAGDFVQGSVIKATLVLRDSNNNLSAGKEQATGITIAS
tara:strand:+ start:886 stop:2118 length:1233 start_codon:yes stop_codon:yes gene_type:complete